MHWCLAIKPLGEYTAISKHHHSTIWRVHWCLLVPLDECTGFSAISFCNRPSIHLIPSLRSVLTPPLFCCANWSNAILIIDSLRGLRARPPTQALALQPSALARPLALYVSNAIYRSCPQALLSYGIPLRTPTDHHFTTILPQYLIIEKTVSK